MKTLDEDYEFSLANKFMADRLLSKIDHSDSREDKVKEVEKLLSATAIETKQRLTWPINLIGIVFAFSNVTTLLILVYALSKDFEYMSLYLKEGVDYVRLIEPKTIMALVAGVTVQSVIAFLAIVKGFYRSVPE